MESNGAFIWEGVKALFYLGLGVGVVGIVNVVDKDEDQFMMVLLISALVTWMIIWTAYVRQILDYQVYFEELSHIQDDFQAVEQDRHKWLQMYKNPNLHNIEIETV